MSKRHEGPTVTAYANHNGEFGEIRAGEKYEADSPLIQGARRKYPELFKRPAESATADETETAAVPRSGRAAGREVR